MEAVKSKLQELIRDHFVEILNKRACRMTWPELFKGWTDERLKETTAAEMWSMVDRFLITGAVPNKSACPASTSPPSASP